MITITATLDIHDLPYVGMAKFSLTEVIRSSAAPRARQLFLLLSFYLLFSMVPMISLPDIRFELLLTSLLRFLSYFPVMLFGRIPVGCFCWHVFRRMSCYIAYCVQLA
jgi:hypothetical protein